MTGDQRQNLPMSGRWKLIRAGSFLNHAVDGSDRVIGTAARIRFQQFREPSFVKIAFRAFTVRRDPFRMLRAQIVVNLNSQGGKSAARGGPGNLRARRFRSDEHDELDNN